MIISNYLFDSGFSFILLIQSTNQPINQSTNQPINQSTNQLNQPIN